MKSPLWLLPLSLLSGCGVNLTYFQSDTPTQRQPAPVEYREGKASGHSSRLVSQAVTHTVKRGDTLYAIARRYRQSLSNIAAWNTLSPPYTLYPGQLLRVSPASHQPPQPVTQPSQSPSPPPLVSPPPVPREQTPTRRVSPNFNRYTRQSVMPPTAIPSSCQPQGQWQWPSQGQVETTHTRSGRQGINIFGQLNHPVVATASGQVIYSGVGVNGYESNLIIIQHNPNWLSVYAHTRSRLVNSGQFVRAGQTIANMGLDLQNRAVLHFELSCNEKTVNPLLYLPPR